MRFFTLFLLIAVASASAARGQEPPDTNYGYHVRTGDHEITPYDWRQYRDFADRHFH